MSAAATVQDMALPRAVSRRRIIAITFLVLFLAVSCLAAGFLWVEATRSGDFGVHNSCHVSVEVGFSRDDSPDGWWVLEPGEGLGPVFDGTGIYVRARGSEEHTAVNITWFGYRRAGDVWIEADVCRDL